MSQTFILKLATDTLLSDAKALAATAEQLQSIEVSVIATITKQQLLLDYKITLPLLSLTEPLQWPSFSHEQVGFNDYLWQQTCLECFVSSDERSYIEINANPNGQYAIYHFEDYRTPACLPPMPLLTNNKDKARLYWHQTKLTGKANKKSYRRRFALSLKDMPYELLAANTQALIHPCVILYFAGTPLYFATAHALPADFHQRRYWSSLQPNNRR